jgi:hypothetical protein
MIARYQLIRGKRPPESPLPDGTRIDIRAHRAHVLSPERAMVETVLANPNAAQFSAFARAYETLLEERFGQSRPAFDALAQAAREGDVYLGCNCPTNKNPDVRRCHTTLALRFLKKKYPKLAVELPKAAS